MVRAPELIDFIETLIDRVGGDGAEVRGEEEEEEEAAMLLRGSSDVNQKL